MYIIAVLTSLGLIGCSAVYNAAKPIYKAGKVVVKEIPLSESTREKLKTVDKVATTYDKARGVLVMEYTVGKSDANTSEVLEKSSTVGGE